MKQTAKALCALLLLSAVLLSFLACKQQASLDELSHISQKTVDGETYYIIDGDYEGDYNIQILDLGEIYYYDDMTVRTGDYGEFDYCGAMSYPEYVAFCHTWGLQQSFSDNTNYVVEAGTMYAVSEMNVRLGGVKFDEETGKMTLYRCTDDFTPDSHKVLGYCIVIPTKEHVQDVCTEEAFQPGWTPCDVTAAKPVIYLYPETDTELTVTLGCPEKLSCAYPAYNSGWNVSAKPDGTLTDLSTGRSLYALYWEGSQAEFRMTDEGFCVAGCDTAAFLEETLAKLGLNEREAEEFIIYWLPLMEDNAYNYIRFASAEEIESYMPLSFSVQPDSVIRINMVWKALDAQVLLAEQGLETPERSGFVAVEWGGVHLK